MFKQEKAFTLVELLVGITISMLLMMSVGVFVSSGMAHMRLQAEILNTSTDIMSWYGLVQNILSSSEKLIVQYDSGALLKIQPKYDNGIYAFIWSKTLNSQYCKAGDTQDFEHLY